MLDFHIYKKDETSVEKAMARLKMAEFAHNVLIMNGMLLRYEDKEIAFKEMRSTVWGQSDG